MLFYTSFIAVTLLVMMATCHFLAVFMKKGANLFALINILLHVALLSVLLIIGAELAEVVMLFMASLTLYVALYYVKDKRRGGGDRNDV